MAEQGMDGWEGGVLAQLARLSAEYQGSGKACARTWREGAHVPGSLNAGFPVVVFSSKLIRGGGVSARAHTLAASGRWVAFGPSEDERLGTRWRR